MPAGITQAPTLLTPILIALAALILGGCATPAFVQSEVDGVGQRLDTLNRLLLDAQARLDAQAGQIAAIERRIGASENAQANLNAKLADTASGLTDANRRLEQLSADAARLGKAGEANAASIAEAHRNVDSIDHRMNAVVAQTAKSLSALADLGERLADIESEFGALKPLPPDAGDPLK